MRCPAPSRAHRRQSVGPFALACPLAVSLLLSIGLSLPAAAQPPRFDDEAQARSTNGAILLSWDADLRLGEHEYELQEAGDPSFIDAELRYRGSFPSFFVSGRRDGTRYFRVRSRSHATPATAAWSEWSAAKTVVVEHHDLRLALALFFGGFAVFLATCLTLVVGSRASHADPHR